MANSFWQQESLIWSAILICIFPLLIVILGEVIIWLQKKNPPLVPTVKIIRSLILPALALLILLDKILTINGNETTIQIVQTLVSVFTIHGVLSLVNGLLFGKTEGDSWQAKVPKLFRDLIRFFLILVGTALVLSFVWKTDLGGLITALGVSSIVVGLALQDTLGNLFSGIALLFERPFILGDWLQVGDINGKVIEINWRSVHLLTRELEMLVIPNAILAKEVLRNYRRPKKLHVEPVDIGFSYDDPPNKVKQVLKQTALETKGVEDKPEPVIHTINYNDSSIDYRIRLFMSDYDRVPQVRDEFMTRIWYAANRNGLTIPFPIRTVYHQHERSLKANEVTAKFIEYLKTFPSFVSIENQYLEQLANNAVIKHFGSGETAISHNIIEQGLYLIIAGKAQVFIRDTKGKEREIALLSRGEFFGEMALLAGNYPLISVKALEDLEVLILNMEAVHNILDRVPRLSREIGETIENRRRIIRSILKSSLN